MCYEETYAYVWENQGPPASIEFYIFLCDKVKGEVDYFIATHFDILNGGQLKPSIFT